MPVSLVLLLYALAAQMQYHQPSKNYLPNLMKWIYAFFVFIASVVDTYRTYLRVAEIAC